MYAVYAPHRQSLKRTASSPECNGLVDDASASGACGDSVAMACWAANCVNTSCLPSGDKLASAASSCCSIIRCCNSVRAVVLGGLVAEDTLSGAFCYRVQIMFK